ncbi:MAG: gas vesicle protein [Proteobacteria bacterium]|nr:gas vesicle protein [Pseudomonadota bacterium]
MTTHQSSRHSPVFGLASPTTQRPVAEVNQHKIDIDGERVRDGLAQLVLTLVKLLHELLERQAIRRMDSGSLDDEEIERLGLALMRQDEELAHLCDIFGFKDDDLNLDLGPLGRLF